MGYLTRVALLCAGLALAACTDGNRFGAGDGADLDPADQQGAGLGAEDGSADDPATPAYFQESVGDRVLFAVDQSTLSGDSESVLDAQADWLLTNTDYTAVIEGHADEQGTREYNIALGDRRANAVRDYLVAQGVPSSRLRTVSYGKERPVELCSDESCYSQNRRAVTVLALGAGS